MSTGIVIKPYAIFDMDGTLVDSMGCWNGVYIEFLTAHGASAYAKELVENTAHLTTYESAVLFRDRLSLDISASDIAVALDARMVGTSQKPRHSYVYRVLHPGTADPRLFGTAGTHGFFLIHSLMRYHR